jgi:Ca2+/Na+ antiporter
MMHLSIYHHCLILLLLYLCVVILIYLEDTNMLSPEEAENMIPVSKRYVI